MSEELIRSLNQRINELQKEVAETRAEAKKRRLEVKAIREERDKALSDLTEIAEGYETLETEYNDHITQAAATPDEMQQTIDSLTGYIREREHKDAFTKVAHDARVRPEALDDLWSLLGYTAESDTPDEAMLAGLVGEALKGRPYLLASDAAASTSSPGGTKPVVRPPLRTEADNGRGDRDTHPRAFQVSEANLRDPKWVDANQKAMYEAQKAGTLEITD